MVRSALVLSALAALAVPAMCATPKVAIVYSSWSKESYSFREEFDDEMAQLGWSYEKFENRDIEGLISRLDEFDLIIASSVANFEHTQDMNKYASQWQAFLERGGCLLITDASYDSVLSKWVDALGADFHLTTKTCVAHTEGTAEAREISVADHPLMNCVHDLAPILRARSFWAHLDSWSDGWSSLVTCRDGKSLFLARHVGKGLVVVTSYFSFKGPSGLEAGTAILDNLWCYVTHSRVGVAVSALKLGDPRPGDHEARVTLQNLRPEKLDLVARLSTEGQGGSIPGEPLRTSLASQESRVLALPYRIASRGEVALTLSLETAAGESISAWPMHVTVPPAVTVSLRRKHLYPRIPAPGEQTPGGTPPLEVVVTVCADAASVGQPVDMAFLVDGKEAQALGDLGAHAEVSLKTSDLAVGEHELTVQATAAGTDIGEAAADFFTHAPARVAVRDDGVLLIAGEPFFPFGWYHVSQSFDEAHRLKMAQDIAGAGFNCAHTRIMKLDRYGPFLDECERLGVYIITEFSAPMFETAEMYRGHPAILAWNPGDEPAAHGTRPETMFERYDRFKQIDPDHLVYTVICQPGEYRNYAKGTDILAPDPYPVPNRPVGMVYGLLKQARIEALKYDTTLIGVLQCFGGYGAWKRPPTPKELRAMTYLALLAGVKGIIYYTYGDGGWVVTDNPEQWEAAKALVPQIERLRPLSFAGLPKMLAEGDEGVFAGEWDLGDDTYVLVVNGSDEERAVDLPIAGGAVEDLFGDGADWQLAGGRLRGSLPAMTSAALRISAK